MITDSIWASPIPYTLGASIALTLLIPKTPVSILSGILFGWTLGTLVMLAVALIAATLNYHLGRYLFRSAMDSLAANTKYRIWLPALRKVTEQGTTKMHFFIRLTPIPTAMISYIMGASGSRMRPFLRGTALAVLPQSLWVNVGASYDQVDSVTANSLKLWSLLVSLAAAVFVTIYVAKLAQRELRTLKQD